MLASMGRPVAVTGSTGFIGSAVVRKLLLDGREVRALIEPRANTTALDEVERDTKKRVDRVEVDVTNFDRMCTALDGCQSLHHLAAIYKVWAPDPTLIHRVNLEGTVTTLLAAQKAKLDKIVYTSSIAAIGLAEGPVQSSHGATSSRALLQGRGLADETTRFNLFDVANDYILTKWQSEQVAMRFAQAGLPVTIVNPAFPFGPRDLAPTPTGKIVLSLLRGEVPGIGEGGFNCIDVEDVAAGHVLAEEKGRVGQRYILGDHNVTMKEFFELVCDVGGVKAPKMPIPSALGAAIALGFELWSDHVSHEEPRATYRAMRYAQRHAWFDPQKARTELGLPSTPLRTSIQRGVDWFRSHGMV